MTEPLAPASPADAVYGLAHLLTQGGSAEALFDAALAALSAVIPYDLAAIWRLDEGELRIIAAAGPLDRPRVRRHRLRLAEHPRLAAALRAGQPRPFDADDHGSSEGDPFDGVLDLPHGHSCMVVPLCSAAEPLGLITLDRSTCGVYPQNTVQLAGIIGQLIAVSLVLAEQGRLLDRYRHQLKEHNRLLSAALGDAEAAIRRLEAAESPAMQALCQVARQVAQADVPVLISGETGTGKEVLAQAIHGWSPRVDGPFVTLNCAAIPSSLVESELFGHVRGAFSGADRERQGRFRTADRGTLLLDEVAELPLDAQAKLLRVLQERRFEPVGSDKSVTVDTRVIAASHVDLADAVRAGRFRDDLYWRLAVFPLALPPLRARVEDIPGVVAGLLQRLERRGQRGPWALSPAALQRLQAEAWPGNVRQLVNVIERATILCPRGRIEPAHLGLPPLAPAPPPSQAEPPAPAAATPAPPPRPATPLRPNEGEGEGEGTAFPSLEDTERRYLQRALDRAGGRIYGPGGAAALAGLKPSTLQSRLQRLGMRPSPADRAAGVAE